MVFLLEKQIYMNTFLNKWVKNLFKLENWRQKVFLRWGKVSEAGV